MLTDASHLYALENPSVHLTFSRVREPSELIETLPGGVDGGDISNKSGFRTSAETEGMPNNNTNRNLSILLGRILKSDRRRFHERRRAAMEPESYQIATVVASRNGASAGRS